jgi:TolB-like protein
VPKRGYILEAAVSNGSTEPPLPLTSKPSIAVLPFANMTGDPEQGFFADGIAEDITTALSKSRSLFVVSRNLSSEYKSKLVGMRDTGRELDVRYVLQGSVRKAGDRVRVTAQLGDAVTGGYLWAGRYDHDLADIFALQDEIATAGCMPQCSQRWSIMSVSAPHAGYPKTLTLGKAIIVACGTMPIPKRPNWIQPWASSGERSNWIHILLWPMPCLRRDISARLRISARRGGPRTSHSGAITRGAPWRSTRWMQRGAPC